MNSGSDQILTWAEFKAFVTTLAAKNVSYFCRGQAEDTWTLSTAFHRRAKALNLSLDKYLDRVVPEVNYEVLAALGHTFDLEDQVAFAAFLALCQHHGFPTPLLDWTLSPYIAAYFAFRDVKESAHATEHVKLFFFDHLNWTQTFVQPLNLRLTVPYISVVRPFPILNYRVLPQQGVFTATNCEDMEAHIRKCEKEAEKSFLQTVRIDVKEKPVVMRDLYFMGIHEITLFPGIDGLFRGLTNRLFAGKMGETLPEIVRKLTRPQTPPVAADPSSLLNLGSLGLYGQRSLTPPSLLDVMQSGSHAQRPAPTATPPAKKPGE